MKLSQEVQMDSPLPLTPSWGPLGTSMSSKTPGSDLEDRWSLDTVSDYGSWWNFPRMFRLIVPFLSNLTPSHGPSGTSMSSKTPGSDLEDRRSLDTVSDYGSWGNFHWRFRWIVPFIWHHLQIHQEPSCPPRLQEMTWWIGGILTQFLTMDLDETFTEVSDE